MKVPGYPSNREADESMDEATAKAGRYASRMRPSRETCLHRELIIPLGVGYARKPARQKHAGFVGVPRGGTLFFCENTLPLIHLIIF